MPSSLNSNHFLSDKRTRATLYAAFLLLLISVVSITLNQVYFHFPGNNYFPFNALQAVFFLMLLYKGATLQYGETSRLLTITQELIFLFVTMSVIGVATNAAQYTPFPTIDAQILAFEQFCHIDIPRMMAFTASFPWFKDLLEFAYNTLPYQMIVIPLLLIAMHKTKPVREYCFFLIVSAILGFTFYYFFPTQAPASILSSDLFSMAQQATALKFSELHHHIQPTTLEGGLIAMPSFHAIWAWFCLYMLRGLPMVLFLFIPLNVLLVLSCVLLGWHYVSDILGALLVVMFSHTLCRKIDLTFENDSSIVSDTLYVK